MEHIPWVEKYRPVHFDDIVLEENNRIILNNIVIDSFLKYLI